eukprot:CAMPEP_0117650666 /NCGR_PEP_ID=MMETSP0804-20121206/1661_1 /TAXON_ID=1074897 /ORGANISM="Tetraselmis astigmatica, Strain CCMP880" /LENGTH=108 /DNA_ID=CAMNT_0005456553 /DNA_START=1416 /DNA_END=1743 /DNA_ORIENTATION=+
MLSTPHGYDDPAEGGSEHGVLRPVAVSSINCEGSASKVCGGRNADGGAGVLDGSGLLDPDLLDTLELGSPGGVDANKQASLSVTRGARPGPQCRAGCEARYSDAAAWA